MTEQDDMEKIRTAHIEQSRMAGHPERLPNNLRKSEWNKKKKYKKADYGFGR